MANERNPWRDCSGYETTSGCPCYDKTPYPCVPKRTGLGYNPNFYVLFCIFLCDKKETAEAGANAQ